MSLSHPDASSSLLKVNGESASVNGSTHGPTLHVEVRLLSSNRHPIESIREHVGSAFRTMQQDRSIRFDEPAESWKSDATLAESVHSIRIGEGSGDISSCVPKFHIYQPAPMDATMDLAADYGEDEDGDDVMAAAVTELPNESLDGVWDTLIYTDNIKTRLLNYIYTTMLFSDANIDFNLITWNRLVLLHGPPGTGKTTLCKALAQKLSIRLGQRYSHGKLIEINSHSLFSKWFSESGKLVQKLFSSVIEMSEDPFGFIIILIDEVESLTTSRSISSGSEPSDAVRVVNAILTQLDKLKYKKNVLVMTTSNISESIDNAFIDRADIKQFIPLPPPQAVFWILKSCLEELMRVGLIRQLSIPQFGQSDTELNEKEQTIITRAGQSLESLAEQCIGVSGRTLRRLPVLAHAKYISTSSSDPHCVLTWIQAMQGAIQDHLREMSQTQKGSQS
ncbi:unnamed protein product [Sympodiomycopsis kandeliae]